MRRVRAELAPISSADSPFRVERKYGKYERRGESHGEQDSHEMSAVIVKLLAPPLTADLPLGSVGVRAAAAWIIKKLK